MTRVALLLAVAGCKQLYGLDDPGHAVPCAATSFANATPTDIAPAEDFSLSSDASRAVVVLRGQPNDVTLSDGSSTPISFPIPYVPVSLAMSSDGSSFLFSATIEPPTIFSATRTATTWTVDTHVPPGSYAGTPSTDALGRRRIVVRTTESVLQEYEDDEGMWMPIGDAHPYDGLRAPSLTTNALTMVYFGPQGDGTYAVFEATRPTVSEWFGTPVAVLAGDHRSPQLAARCQQLYVIDPPDSDVLPIEPVLRRYDL